MERDISMKKIGVGDDFWKYCNVLTFELPVWTYFSDKIIPHKTHNKNPL